MKRNQYTTEFKREAVRLMIMDGLSASEVSARLGVHRSQLNRWKQRHLAEMDAESDQPVASSPSQLAAENVRLRRQLAKERRIVEIPRKTVSFFATET